MPFSLAVNDLLLAALAQRCQCLGERIGRHNPTSEGATVPGETIIMIGQRVLAVFEKSGIVVETAL